MTKFPLESAPFPPIHFIDSDKELLLELADDFVAQTIEDYERHLHYNNGLVNSTQWVRVKQFEDVVVYEDRQALKERRLSRVSPSRAAKRNEDMLKLLWSGTILGDLDDVMFAAVSRTAEETKVKAAYVESNVVDVAVLNTLVHPTREDPFHGVQVKWAVNAGPPMMRSVVRCRDFVYLESTGMTTTSTGERIGFQLLHSISTPGAPELHEHKLVRGNMTLYHLFRQKSDGVVETYVKAFIDLMGDMPLRVATTLSTSGVVTVWKLGEYALMKKLNWMLSQRRAIVPVKRSDWCATCNKSFRGNMARRRACKICMNEICARCCVPKRMFFVPVHSRAVVRKSTSVCTGCIKKTPFVNSVDITLGELSRTTGPFKAYTYWASPTSSSSSIMFDWQREWIFIREAVAEGECTQRIGVEVARRTARGGVEGVSDSAQRKPRPLLFADCQMELAKWLSISIGDNTNDDCPSSHGQKLCSLSPSSPLTSVITWLHYSVRLPFTPALAFTYSSRMKFPLAHAPFAPPRLGEGDRKEVVELADLFVQQTLDDYETHLDMQRGVVDEVRWKTVKHFEDVVVYQEREAMRPRRLTLAISSSGSGYEHRERPNEMQKLLWFGTVHGSLDDIMYGVINPTAEEAKVKASYVGSNVLDFAVLDTIVRPTTDDPFRGLQIKWAVNGGPSMMRPMVRCRDFVYLESTGIATSSSGERIGYHILHSVVVPGAPELHDHKIIRGNMALYHLYRQKSDGVVETYVKAFIDVMGDMPSSIATLVSAKGVVSVWKLGDYAEMKKLTWLLKHKAVRSHQNSSSSCCRVCHKDVSGALSRRLACCICSSCVCSRCSVPKKLHYMSPLTRTVMQTSVAVCAPCMRTLLTTSGLDAAQAVVARSGLNRGDFHDGGSIKDTSSSSSASSHAW
ncbi:hypothetical protein PHYPSEUDO_013434 [Phytophthora pseudosyringae]|uniref:FYVE-type domain-containing protein n=1 Tax=Phytophthora pseudosyringae TaxID=221518 RepID=A0A8T1WHS1_9STRA|nr:hypothetical protein PHYPSEUDO_013434 [Phytophthora pseudosyringae]